MASQKNQKLDLVNCDWDDGPLIEAYEKAKAKAAAKILKNSKKQASKDSNAEEKHWRVGSYCRALYPEDGYYYEAKIVDLLSDEGTCLVEFLGYEEQEEVEFKSLRASKGKKSRKEQLKSVLETSGMSLTCGETSDAASDSNASTVTEHRRKVNRPANAAAPLVWHPTVNGQTAPRPNVVSYYAPPAPMASCCGPPPLPPMSQGLANDPSMGALLRSWYLAGYYCGLYEQNQRGSSSCPAQCCYGHSNQYFHH